MLPMWPHTRYKGHYCLRELGLTYNRVWIRVEASEKLPGGTKQEESTLALLTLLLLYQC